MEVPSISSCRLTVTACATGMSSRAIVGVGINVGGFVVVRVLVVKRR